MWEKDDRMAEQLSDTALWESRILQLSEDIRKMLQLTASSVLAGLEGGPAVSFRPVPVTGFLTERIASGGNMALPTSEGGDLLQEVNRTLSSPQPWDNDKRVRRTPYETARELQKQSELLLRT